LRAAEGVLEEYRAHWPLTVRQVYYRLIGAHGYEKTEDFYKKLGNHMANARRARVIPFEAIRDDGVTTVTMTHYADQEHFKAHIRGLGGTPRGTAGGSKVHIELGARRRA
jgi:hypothetical protein